MKCYWVSSYLMNSSNESISNEKDGYIVAISAELAIDNSALPFFCCAVDVAVVAGVRV